jgi:diaminohydroxyphosphoribosylaminopyrimidine deaminase / 5-amino-6-(5-phosphoribosylamino)uracil reductase
MRMTDDSRYIQRCLDLAPRGAGSVSPNPMVGCVIVKGGNVVGEGYHQRFGGPHAERVALSRAKISVRGATLYVNLEPCSHYGKTPPCVDVIIESGIRRVVVGVLDPNPIIAGRGVKILRDAGIDVTIGVKEDECRDINKVFFKYIRTHRPYILLKIAQTLDGYIASKNHPGWITSPSSRKLVHKWRGEYDAVLIGAGTVNADNPSLTVRYVRGRQPLRIVVDGKLSSDPRAHIFNDRHAEKTYLIAEEQYLRYHRKKQKVFEKKKIVLVSLRGKRRGVLSFSEIFRALSLIGISSVIVEGGAEVFRHVAAENLADELAIFIAPTMFHQGIPAFGDRKANGMYTPLKLTSPVVTPVGRDVLLQGKLTKE